MGNFLEKRANGEAARSCVAEFEERSLRWRFAFAANVLMFPFASLAICNAPAGMPSPEGELEVRWRAITLARGSSRVDCLEADGLGTEAANEGTDWE